LNENLAESRQLAWMFARLERLHQPVIARVQGAAIGGGCGLVAASDLAVATEAAVFSLAEVRLGLIPAVISPYLVRRIGEGRTRELFLTGRRIDGREAARLGLVTRAVPAEELDRRLDDLIRRLMVGGPAALAAAKRLLTEIRDLTAGELRDHTARTIAELRLTPEAQEGMRAFLDKRPPIWTDTEEPS